MVRGKLNEVTVFSKCHVGNSFYFTEVGHRHQGLRREFLMEVGVKAPKLEAVYLEPGAKKLDFNLPQGLAA